MNLMGNGLSSPHVVSKQDQDKPTHDIRKMIASSAGCCEDGLHLGALWRLSGRWFGIGCLYLLRKQDGLSSDMD